MTTIVKSGKIFKFLKTILAQEYYSVKGIKKINFQKNIFFIGAASPLKNSWFSDVFIFNPTIRLQEATEMTKKIWM
jgi:hypothetical protein